MKISVRGVCALLQVYDMPASLRFYRDVLGFEVIQSSQPGDQADWIWLRLEGAELMLNTAYEAHDRPATPDPSRATSHADTGLFSTVQTSMPRIATFGRTESKSIHPRSRLMA